MFTDLARGAVAVVQSTGKEASRTVGHKYGSDAEMVADNSLSAAGNTAILVHVSQIEISSAVYKLQKTQTANFWCMYRLTGAGRHGASL